MAGSSEPSAPPRDPRRRYCPECGADITRSCSWFALPTGPGLLTISILPELCPECGHLLRPAPSPVVRPGRPS